MLVLGDREVEAATASIRLRTGETLDPMSTDEAASMMVDAISARSDALTS
jgi:threonyl-tRNA synthetase